MIPSLPHLRRRPRRAARRAMSIIIVLGMLAMTMAVSFVMIRWEVTTSQTQDNVDLNYRARQVAMTGMAAAMRKMHESGWSGADSGFSASLSSTQTYSVTYSTGDAALSASSSNYAMWPYRVTLLITGTVVDPSHPTVKANAQVEAVMELLPRNVSTVPAAYTTMLNYTLCQHTSGDFTLNGPCRVEGPIWLRGAVSLFPNYPYPSDSASRYLRDLERMRSSRGYPDYRPVNGPISMPTGSTSTTMKSRLTSDLSVTTNNVSSTAQSGWTYPTTINSSYRLYPGGKLYSAVTLSSQYLSGTTLEADPKTNPLGIFYRSGSVNLRDNTTIRGTLISPNVVTIEGVNVRIEPPTLPPLYGTTVPLKMPAVICNQDFNVSSGAGLVVRGVVAAFRDFSIAYGTTATSVDIQGRVLCRGFNVAERSEWDMSSSTWSFLWSWFTANNNSSVDYPVWLWALGRSPVPDLNVTQESSNLRYHWHDPSTQLYQPHSSDTYLRWSLVRWTIKN